MRRPVLIRAASLTLAGVALASACGSDGPDAAASEAHAESSVAVQTVDEAAARAAAVDVRADGCGPRVGFGTGAMVAERYALTAAHVVAGASDVEVIDTGGASTTADVVWFDPELDFAVLRTEEPVGTPVAVRPSRAEVGATGVVVLPRSTSDGMTVEVANVVVLRTVVINTTDIYREDDVRRNGFEIEGSLDPGDSGGLVVLPDGGAGIVWSRSNQREARAWAIDIPSEFRETTTLDRLRSPADVGPCIR